MFVDTSGWACYLARREPLHPTVTALLQTTITHGHRLITTNYVITELVALLGRYFSSRSHIIAAINRIKQDSNITTLHIDVATDAEAWQLLEARLDKAWSLVDASSFVVMRRFGIMEAVTTDHHFDQAGFTRLPLPRYSGAANDPSVMPPSTTSTVPVVKLAAGEAR